MSKPEVETFVLSGAQMFGDPSEVAGETRNGERELVAESFVLPNKEKIHQVLDLSWYFNKFEISEEHKRLRSKRSTSEPRETFEKEFSLFSSNKTSFQQEFRLIRGLIDV